MSEPSDDEETFGIAHPTTKVAEPSDADPRECGVCGSRRIVKVNGGYYCVDCFKTRRYDYVR